MLDLFVSLALTIRLPAVAQQPKHSEVRNYIYCLNYLVFTDGSFETNRRETVRPSNW